MNLLEPNLARRIAANPAWRAERPDLAATVDTIREAETMAPNDAVFFLADLLEADYGKGSGYIRWARLRAHSHTDAARAFAAEEIACCRRHVEWLEGPNPPTSMTQAKATEEAQYARIDLKFREQQLAEIEAALAPAVAAVAVDAELEMACF